MERRRLAVVLAGLVLVGGAVTALRLVGGTPDVHATPPPPPLPTVIKPFNAVGVLAPTPGTNPAAPGRLVLTPGPHRLLVAWGAALPGGQNPPGVTGYDIRWGTGSLTNEKLVAESAVELDGLATDRNTDVQVRSVDEFGQRSMAATATGRARPDGPPGADNALVDHFDGAQVPDPLRWRLASPNNCAQALRGTGQDSQRMVLLSECGRSSATLRARAPFNLDPAAPGGELGRFTIDTDAPGESGELAIDLVPGPVDLLDGSTNDPVTATQPNVAAIDTFLPPGTIRVRIATDIPADTARPQTTVQVAAAPNTPAVPVAGRPLNALPTPTMGASARWDVVLRTDGVVVLRDGVPVAGGNVVPGWRSATALVEFTGSTFGQLRAGINLIGFGGAPTSAPPSAAAPTIRPDNFVRPVPGAGQGATTVTDTGPGSAQLRVTVVAAPNTATSALTVNGVVPNFQVEINSQTYPAVPAVPGTALLPEVRYPLVARIPASALTDQTVEIAMSMDVPSRYPADVEMVAADLEMTPGPNTRPAGPSDASAGAGLVPVPAQLAVLTARVLDASGQPMATGKALPRGRAVLEVTMDGLAQQRAAWALAGLAGFKVWLDNNELVAVPTAMAGPGVGGTWRIAFDQSQATVGPHTIDVRAYGAARGVAFAEAFAAFALR
jgi:hypothetical protein